MVGEHIPHFVTGDTVTSEITVCINYKTLSREQSFNCLPPLSTNLAYLSMIYIAKMAGSASSAGQPGNKYHGQISQLWQKCASKVESDSLVRIV